MVEAVAGPGAGSWEGSRQRGLAVKAGPGFEFRLEEGHFTTMSFNFVQLQKGYNSVNLSGLV